MLSRMLVHPERSPTHVVRLNKTQSSPCALPFLFDIIWNRAVPPSSLAFCLCRSMIQQLDNPSPYPIARA